MIELSKKVLLIANVLIVLHIRSFSTEETQNDEVPHKSKKIVYNSNIHFHYTIKVFLSLI